MPKAPCSELREINVLSNPITNFCQLSDVLILCEDDKVHFTDPNIACVKKDILLPMIPKVLLSVYK